MEPADPVRIVHLKGGQSGAQRCLGFSVFAFLPTRDDIEYWGFVPNSNPDRVDVVEVKSRSGDDFMRVAKVQGPYVQYILEPRRGKGGVLGLVLRFIRLIVIEKLRGYRVAPV